MSANKTQEALQRIAAAEQYLKTGLLKWKPDFDSAADEYTQAAQCYRILRNPQKTKECHMLASDCHKKNKALFHAAKSIENAIIAAKDVLAPLEIYAMAEEACSLYQQHGSADSGANVLDKAAKIITEKTPERAMQLYKLAADVSAGETTSHQAVEFISKASRLMVKLGMYDDAVQSVIKEIGYHQEHGTTGSIGRLVIVLVLLHLARGDSVAAGKSYREWGSYCETPEARNLEALLTAFDEEDADTAKRALADPFIRHMDVEYAHLATLIPLPGNLTFISRAMISEALAKKTPSFEAQEHSTPGQGTSAPPTLKEEDEEGGLC